MSLASRRRAMSVRHLIAGLTIAAVAAISQARAQDSSVAALSGTLKKVKDTGSITLGYRESSLPFSYLNKRAQPIGYSLDLCREIVEEASTELDGMDIKVALRPVTSADRLARVKAGEIDLECGSTTSNLQRQKEVAFSPIFFVAGTKLMVPKTSRVTSYRDLARKTVVVTAGTTNEVALQALSDKQKLSINIVTARDHAESFAMLEAGNAAAFATDDVLLYGILATEPRAHDMNSSASIFHTILMASSIGGMIQVLPPLLRRLSPAWRSNGVSPNSTTSGSCTVCRRARPSTCRWVLNSKKSFESWAHRINLIARYYLLIRDLQTTKPGPCPALFFRMSESTRMSAFGR